MAQGRGEDTGGIYVFSRRQEFRALPTTAAAGACLLPRPRTVSPGEEDYEEFLQNVGV